jgi:NDP-sugar pyrophosphorylase family protein
MRVLDQLAAAGITDVVLCTGYLAEQVRAYLGSGYGGMAVLHSVEDRPLGTAGALRKAVDLLATDLVLAMNGDSFVGANLEAFIRWHLGRGLSGSLLSTWVHDCASFGTLDVDAQGAVQAFREKEGKAVPGWINAGVYLFPKRWLEELGPGEPLSLEHQVLPTWVARGLGAYCVRAPFLDIGTPEALAKASRFFAGIDRRAPSKSVS